MKKQIKRQMGHRVAATVFALAACLGAGTTAALAVAQPAQAQANGHWAMNGHWR
jgi:hypothetical protein